ncbi:hypothetical protein L6452_00952 [Arctium lappa]|uniref:Uncharacterized protein n=1 Tax=Arctium lappa TaxID=4217 RepID=A0ACB9FES9_ARCLA|nr:hypothetical protein L6452_00952 [Arctium lappa]
MDRQIEVVRDCNEGNSLKQIDDYRSPGLVDKFDDALDEVVGSLIALISKSKQVVLAFDSLQCNTVKVVDGVSKSVEVFRVEDCFVPDEVVDDEGWDFFFICFAHEFSCILLFI